MLDPFFDYSMYFDHTRVRSNISHLPYNFLLFCCCGSVHYFEAMGRAPCCDKSKVKRGSWSREEDAILKNYLNKHGTVDMSQISVWRRLIQWKVVNSDSKLLKLRGAETTPLSPRQRCRIQELRLRSMVVVLVNNSCHISMRGRNLDAELQKLKF